MIRLFQPSLGNDELDAISSVFSDQWPGMGPRVAEFESQFADYVKTEKEQLISITSCTEGLFQSIHAIDLSPSDEVILPSISFIGAAHAVRAVGAQIRLTDVDPLTLNPTIDHIQKRITSKTKAMLLIHFGGRYKNFHEIVELAKAKGIVLIEDSACSLGGKNNGISFGTFGDIGIWSFDAMKLLVTGDGGMIRVKDERLRQQISNRVKLGGLQPGLESSKNKKIGWWEVDPICWGRRAFMNDLTAAIGLVQLKRINSFISRRLEITLIYDNALKGIPWIQLPPALEKGDVPYFYWIQTTPETRNSLALHLQHHGIYTTFRYWPLHRTKLYSDQIPFPGADFASNTTLLLPLHQNLTDDEVQRVIDTIKSFQ